MSKGVKTALIILGVILVFVFAIYSYVKGTYNSLVMLDEGVMAAWAQDENQLQRRYDLIPNYVETFNKAYRVLKNGGQMIFSVDALENIDDQVLLQHHKKKFYVEIYFRKNELIQILKKTGFKNIRVYPIVKTKYAKNLFIKALKKNFRFSMFQIIFGYYILKIKDNRSLKQKGIFLIASCTKEI